jgi:hypothetical protein
MGGWWHSRVYSPISCFSPSCLTWLSTVGAALMDAVTGDPRLVEVGSIELVCQPELFEFYRRWGFTTEVGASRLMRRTDDPLLRNAAS